jgi:hypothetical protein
MLRAQEKVDGTPEVDSFVIELEENFLSCEVGRRF